MCQHVIQYTGEGQAQAWQAGISLGVDVSDLGQHVSGQHNKVPRGFVDKAINIAFDNSGITSLQPIKQES